METLGKILGTVLLMMVSVLIVGTITMWLWNYVMPDLFGLPELTWFKSLCLYFLSQLLFTSRQTLNFKDK